MDFWRYEPLKSPIFELRQGRHCQRKKLGSTTPKNWTSNNHTKFLCRYVLGQSADNQRPRKALISNLTFVKEKGAIPMYTDSTIFSVPGNRFAYLSQGHTSKSLSPWKVHSLEVGNLPVEICGYFWGSAGKTAKKGRVLNFEKLPAEKA